MSSARLLPLSPAGVSTGAVGVASAVVSSTLGASTAGAVVASVVEVDSAVPVAGADDVTT